MSAELLSVRGLHIGFTVAGQQREVVRDVAFGLRRGQVLALVGESGSGKSATALAIMGLLPANGVARGGVRLDGEELLGADPRRLREVRGGRIGAIFQEPTASFNPVFTIGAQIAEAIRAHRGSHNLPPAPGPSARAERWPDSPRRWAGRAAVRARVVELLGTVGLPDPRQIAAAYPHELSGGQLQRAMTAMAIGCAPAMLIADEPTTALDVTVQAGILDLLRDLRTRLGMGILLITHDMGVVADIADEVVVLRDGAVVEQAPAVRLFAEPGAGYTRALLAAVPRLGESRPVPAGVAAGGSPPAGPVTVAQATDPTTPGTGPAEQHMVELRDVVIEYPLRHGGRLRAVDTVSLEIAGGEVLGLVGESGSGKSTIGRALCGLVPVTAGTVRLGGVELAHVPRRRLRQIRAGTGIVFQDPVSSLDPRRTAADSIAEPLLLHAGLDAAARRERVRELLDAVALPQSLGGRYPHEMSGGQRQRVAIARAVALHPRVLVADEPTSALDVTVQARILDLLRSLQLRFGFACLFVSHDLAVTAALADRVAVMYQGHIVEQGPAERVLQSPVDGYTRRLLAAAPVADPVRQASRRAAWRELVA